MWVRWIIGVLLVWLSLCTDARATNYAGTNGTSCQWTTLATAIANSGGSPIYLATGHTFTEGGITISQNQEIHVGGTSCTPSPGAGVAHAVISGSGNTLAHLSITSGADVEFERVDVIDHLASGTSPNDQGGNIYVDGSSQLTLRNSVISGGVASEGGGIYSNGGAIKLYGDGTNITDNSADDGGGIHSAGDVYMYDASSVSGNHALATFGGGGVLMIGDLSLVPVLRMADEASISSNDATDPPLNAGWGGGVLLYAYAAIDTSDCTSCAIEYNTAFGAGGGIASIQSDSIVLVNTSVSHNIAATGGGVYASCDSGFPLAIQTSVYIEDATFSQDLAVGGGLGTPDGVGGAIALVGDYFDYVTIRGSTQLDSNYASAAGGGMYAEDVPTLEVYDLVVSNNSTDAYGGGIAVEGAAISTFYNPTVEGNLSLDAGGGMFLNGPSSVVCYSCLFLSNTANTDGGGVAVYIDGNSNRPTLSMDGRLGVEGCDGDPLSQPAADEYCSEFRENSAGSKGGGLFMETGDATIERTAFLENRAVGEARAIDLFSNDGPVLELTNSLVAENTGTGTLAVVVVGNGSTLNAEHMTVTGNTGVPVRYNSTASGYFKRSIVWDASAFTVNGSGHSITATCSSFGLTGGGSGVAGAGSVTGVNIADPLDPQFTTTARGNYRLNWVSQANHSPEIDACNTGLSPDMDDITRPVSKVTGTTTPYDRGAFERP